MFTLGPTKITKEVILKRHTEEEIMAFYLGVNPQPGLFCSPLRADENPTCSFYRDSRGVLIFKDFGNGFHGDFINVVEFIYKVNYAKALNIIANDFNIIQKTNYVKNEPKIFYDGSLVKDKGPTIIQCEIKDFTDKELEWWLSFGITKKTLKKFRVFSIKHVFLNGELKFTSRENNPIYGYYFGKKNGIELWKIYFPLQVKGRFLLNCSELQGLKQLDTSKEFVVVTKSYKDVMSLYELGITAIAPQAESIVLDRKQIVYLRKHFKYIVTNGDWDRAGQTFMIKSRKLYPTICLSFKKKNMLGKDISDYIKKHGLEKARKLIEKLLYLKAKGTLDYQFKYYKL